MVLFQKSYGRSSFHFDQTAGQNTAKTKRNKGKALFFPRQNRIDRFRWNITVITGTNQPQSETVRESITYFFGNVDLFAPKYQKGAPV